MDNTKFGTFSAYHCHFFQVKIFASISCIHMQLTYVPTKAGRHIVRHIILFYILGALHYMAQRPGAKAFVELRNVEEGY